MWSEIRRRLASRPLRLGAGVLVSALTLYLAAREVRPTEVWQALTTANPGWLALALGSVAVNTLARALRWRTLLGRRGASIPFSKLLVALILGMTLNLIFPARAGDLSRAYTVGGLGPGRTFTLGTVALEKLLDLVAFAILFLALVALMPLPDWVDASALTLVALALACALLLALLIYRREQARPAPEAPVARQPGSLRAHRAFGAWNTFVAWSRARLRPALASLEVLQTRAALTRLALWTAVVWGTGLLTNHLTLLALQIYLPLSAALLVLVALQIGISIPSVPGRIGVFEYLCVLSLAIFGVARGPGLSYGLLLHFISMLPMILGGPAAIWTLGGTAAAQGPSEVAEELQP